MQELYDTYKEKGFSVLGFPSNQFKNQEPGTNEEIANSCKLHFGVTFPLYKKIDVKGENAHPLYQYLTKQAKGILGASIKWNFTKFLVDQKGNIVKRYAPSTSPLKIAKDIERLLQ